MLLVQSSSWSRFVNAALVFSVAAFGFAHRSDAAIIGLNDPNLSSLGVAAQIITAPADIGDNGATNQAQQGFNEVQDYVTTSDIVHDFGTISAGTEVDSHMIFFNATTETNAPGLVSHVGVEWLFSGRILGVMSDGDGSLEVASSGALGGAGTAYALSAFTSRGLEFTSADTSVRDDYEIIDPFTLRLSMHVLQPGDWIRVVTAASMPEPSTAILLGLGLFGLAGYRRRLA